MRFWRATAVFGAWLTLLWAGQARAVVENENYKLDFSLSIQPTFQHHDASNIEYVQQRQELRLGGIYKAIPLSKASNGFFRKLDFSLLWRGRYDAVYDIRQSYKNARYNRDDFRFPEGSRPREAYADVEFNGALQPLSFRIGKQQVVWGEADFFRSLDVINPLRLDQMGLVGDDLDNYREPLWVAKALYNFGDFSWVSGLAAEAFYSPDGRPLTNKIILGDGWRIQEGDFNACFPQPLDCHRPHANTFARVRHPWEIERVGPDYSTAPDQGDLNLSAIQSNLGIPANQQFLSGKADFIYLGNQKFGDRMQLAPNGWKEIDPAHRSMFGVRLMGQTALGGVYFTLNYLYKRAEIPAPYIGWETVFDPTLSTNGGYNLRADVAARATSALLSPDLNGDGVPDGNEALLRECTMHSTPELILGPMATGSRTVYGYQFPSQSLGAACVPVKLWYPFSHIIGFTGTYNDDGFSGAILRTEQSVSTKEPRTKRPALLGVRAGNFPTGEDFAFGDKETTLIWRSMVGFDYLRALFRYSQLPGPARAVPIVRSLLTDQWFFTFQFFNEYWSNVSNQLGQDFSPTNRHMHWNPIMTLIMTGFFLHNHVRPTIAFAYETDTSFPVLWLQWQHFLTPDLQVRIGEVNYMGSSHAENFLLLNKYANRDTAYVRFTYFFL